MGKKKKYGPPLTVAPERVDQLVDQLEAGTAKALSDDEMAALCSRLEGDDEVDGLLRLLDVADNSRQKKSVKQALFRLGKRGLAVPDLKARSGGIRLTPRGDPADELPTLLYEPFAEGRRFFYFPYSSGRSLLVVSARFEEPVGLKELTANESSRSRFRQTVKLLRESARIDGRLAVREADRALRDRKLWEIGVCVRSARTGTEVDPDVCTELRWPDEPPPHPARALDLDDVEPMTLAELDAEPRFLVPFYNSTLFERLDEDMRSASESPLILSGATETDRVRDLQKKSVMRWLAEWDQAALAETLLDTALFHSLAGEPRAARAFRDAVTSDEPERREAQLARFLERVLSTFFAADQEKGPPGSVSPGGIILP